MNITVQGIREGGYMEQKTWCLFPRSPEKIINVYLTHNAFEMNKWWKI